MDNVDINGSVANETVNKWAPVLEGIESDYTRRVTAQLLENQAKAIISDKLREDVTADIGGMNTVGRLGTFQKFAFPLVRRVYPELIANNIVGVQPMQGPVSQIFYLGNSRRDSTTAAGGDGTQTIYSKYNLTYRGLIADPIATGGNIDLDRPADLNLDVSNVMSATSGGPEVTVGGEIANFPNPARKVSLVLAQRL
jgi:hypothetical protein